MLVDQRAARAGVRIFKLGVLGSQQLGNYCHVMVHRKLSFFYLSTHSWDRLILTKVPE
jgi:hypothetical protein